MEPDLLWGRLSARRSWTFCWAGPAVLALQLAIRYKTIDHPRVEWHRPLLNQMTECLSFPYCIPSSSNASKLDGHFLSEGVGPFEWSTCCSSRTLTIIDGAAPSDSLHSLRSWHGRLCHMSGTVKSIPSLMDLHACPNFELRIIVGN